MRQKTLATQTIYRSPNGHAPIADKTLPIRSGPRQYPAAQPTHPVAGSYCRHFGKARMPARHRPAGLTRPARPAPARVCPHRWHRGDRGRAPASRHKSAPAVRATLVRLPAKACGVPEKSPADRGCDQHRTGFAPCHLPRAAAAPARESPDLMPDRPKQPPSRPRTQGQGRGLAQSSWSTRLWQGPGLPPIC